ncbi:hypothetical protein [sulfur-oxidizing endosymbiont of Gigantopelta aegis]|uniref:hypothetical protein n=1 Tax=sulfur-oxidizing endosymbiont of Gigantopelta aegis TaxID=2794934 RepID=UPI0018DDA3D9|nr:hypothetical protein [sulfur-oxidizing endosymbiont of Gigantopelta aegis]
MKNSTFIFVCLLLTNISFATQVKSSSLSIISMVTNLNTQKNTNNSTDVPANILALPLINISDFTYQGAFRIKSGTKGESKPSYSHGRLAFNSDHNSLFLSGFNLHGSIAEFEIPPLVISDQITDLNIGAYRQEFRKVLSESDTGNTQNINRVGGMEYINGELLIQVYDYFDGGANNTHTSLVARDANNLSTSNIDGFFEFSGKAHEILWVSPIPPEYQAILGGDYISGASSADQVSINARSSMGPSAWIFNSSDIIGKQASSGQIPSTAILDFSLAHIMADTPSGWLPFSKYSGVIQFNYQTDVWFPTIFGKEFLDAYDPKNVGNNDIWTDSASANYGLIIPGTRTYAVFGQFSMRLSGGGYKIMQDNGHICQGPCQFKRADTEHYYWLFDMADMIAVKQGVKQPYEVKPYARGRFNTPFNTIDDPKGKTMRPRIAGGTYDESSGT